MNPGITRWKVVPSYSGLPCIFCLVSGLVQSLVPCARSIKLATVSGASFENNLQVIRPIVVSKTAVGPVGLGATGTCVSGESGRSWLDWELEGWLDVEGFGGVDCCVRTVPVRPNERSKIKAIRTGVF